MVHFLSAFRGVVAVIVVVIVPSLTRMSRESPVETSLIDEIMVPELSFAIAYPRERTAIGESASKLAAWIRNAFSHVPSSEEIA